MMAPASVTMSAPAAWSQIFSRYPACGKRRFTAASPRASAPATSHRTCSEAGKRHSSSMSYGPDLCLHAYPNAEASLRHGAPSGRAAWWAPKSWPVSATGLRAGILTYRCYAHDTPMLAHASGGGGSNAPPSCNAAHPRDPAALAPLSGAQRPAQFRHRSCGNDSPYLAWLSMRSGGRVTPRRAARRPVKEWSECLDSYDSMKRAVLKSLLSSSASRRACWPPEHEVQGLCQVFGVKSIAVTRRKAPRRVHILK